jgi:hypothetical protein
VLLVMLDIQRDTVVLSLFWKQNKHIAFPKRTRNPTNPSPTNLKVWRGPNANADADADSVCG